eukprot:s2192_g13.t1
MTELALEAVRQELQHQHEVLLVRLDEWISNMEGRLQKPPPLYPRVSIPEDDSVEHGSPDALLSLDEDPIFPKILNGGSKSFIVEEDRDPSAGLDSYTLAKQQGSRIDILFKSKTEEASLTAPAKSMATSLCPTLQRWCSRIVGSLFCEMFFAFVILTNSIYLGVQLEVTASQGQDAVNNEITFAVLNIFYAVVFLLEVCLRLVAFGPRAYFFATSWAWNWLDIFVVTSTWVELLVGLMEVEGSEGLSNSNLRLLRLVKVSRLARVMRMLRVVQYVKPLRTLMHCLVDTTKSFVWSFLLLFLMMYVFGLLFTDAVLDYIFDQQKQAHGQASDHEQLSYLFGSVASSIQTLFRSVSNGLDWSEAADELEPVGFIWVWIFNFYICIITLVLVNVWLGRYQAWPAANLWGVSVAVLFLFFLVVVVLLRAL